MVLTTLARLQKDYAWLKSENATRKVDEAIARGQLTQGQRAWAIEYCSARPKGFAAFLAGQPKIIENNPDGTLTLRVGEPPADALTPKELMVCRTMGITPEAFVAAKRNRAQPQ